MSEEIELAWAAGFWDGEGCTYRSPRQWFMEVNQTEVTTLERFMAAVGVGKIYGPRMPHKTTLGTSPQWRWRIGSLPNLKVVIGTV